MSDTQAIERHVGEERMPASVPRTDIPDDLLDDEMVWAPAVRAATALSRAVKDKVINPLTGNPIQPGDILLGAEDDVVPSGQVVTAVSWKRKPNAVAGAERSRPDAPLPFAGWRARFWHGSRYQACNRRLLDLPAVGMAQGDGRGWGGAQHAAALHGRS